MLKKLYLISGVAESGKDAFAEIAIKLLYPNFGSTARHAFAFAVKEIAKNSFGWNEEKDENGRALLQLIGDGGRKYNPDIWIEKMIETLNSHQGVYDHILLTDCRYPNEINFLKAWGKQNGYDCNAIRIIRPNHVSKLSPEQRLNSSETALDDFKEWDYTLVNDGTYEEFKLKVAEIVLDIIKRA